MPHFGSISTIIKRRASRILPAGAVAGVLGISLLVGAPGIIGLGTGYNYGGPNCSSANLTTDNFSGANPGTVITLTASATGCTNPEFQFYISPAGNAPGTGFLAQDGFKPWPQNTFTWDTTGLPQGQYQIGVWARHSGSTGSYEAYWIGNFQLSTPFCTGTEIFSASPAAPQPSGTSVTFSAGCFNLSGNVDFQFWEKVPGGSAFVKKQVYSSNNTFTTVLTGTGVHLIGVWARGTGSPTSYDAYGYIAYQVS